MKIKHKKLITLILSLAMILSGVNVSFAAESERIQKNFNFGNSLSVNVVYDRAVTYNGTAHVAEGSSAKSKQTADLKVDLTGSMLEFATPVFKFKNNKNATVNGGKPAYFTIKLKASGSATAEQKTAVKEANKSLSKEQFIFTVEPLNVTGLTVNVTKNGSGTKIKSADITTPDGKTVKAKNNKDYSATISGEIYKLDFKGNFTGVCTNDPSYVPEKEEKKSVIDTEYVTVSFSTKGGTAVPDQKLKKGNSLVKPEDPVKEGNTFGGWYTDESYRIPYDFGGQVNSDITLYAKWLKDKFEEPGEAVETTYDASKDDLNVQKYLVRFWLGKGENNPYETQRVKLGGTAKKPVNDPQKNDYEFVGWYNDIALTDQCTFNEGISEDTNIYARWRKIGGADKIDLFTDQDVLLSGSDSEVFFKAESDIELKKIGLYEITEKDDTGKAVKYEKVADLADDGKYSQDGDDLPGDGIFTARLKASKLYSGDTAKTKEYVTGCETGEGDQKTVIYSTKVAAVEFKIPISEETLKKMDAANAKITALTESFEGSDIVEEEKQKEAKALADNLKKAGTIKNVEVFDNGSFISFEYDDGIMGAISTETFEIKGDDPEGAVNGPEERVEYDEDGEIYIRPSKEEVSILGKDPDDKGLLPDRGTALILNAFPSFETDPDNIEYRTKFYEELRDDWNKDGLLTTLDTTVTVSDFLTMPNYNVVCISTHGSQYLSANSIGGYDSIPVICLREKASTSNNQKYDLMLQNNDIRQINGYYRILPDFFLHQYGDNDLNDVFIFSECCTFMGTGEGSSSGNYDYRMPNNMISKGANAVVGFHNSVLATYSREFMKNWVNELLGRTTNPDQLNDEGKTAKESYDIAANNWGHSHEEYWNNTHVLSYSAWWKLQPENWFKAYDANVLVAYPVFNGDPDAMLINNNLKNGDFELFHHVTSVIDTPSYWVAEGHVRTVTQLGDAVSPDSGNGKPNMAMITSGAGSMNDATFGDGTEGSRISQRFVVPGNCDTIEYQYNMISEEPMEWVGSIFDDAFGYQIAQGGSLKLNETVESINSSEWLPISGVNFEGGDNTAYQTGWKTGTIDVSEYKGKIITLSFVVYDKGDRIYDSACLIENVKLGAKK